MPKDSKNNKNGLKSKSFELLRESNDNESITVESTSVCGCPLLGHRLQNWDKVSEVKYKEYNKRLELKAKLGFK